MKIENILLGEIKNALFELYTYSVDTNQIQLQNTRKDLSGDITLVVFPFLRFSKKSPEQTAQEIGEYLQKKISKIESFNVIKGFLNFEIANDYWLENLLLAYKNDDFGILMENENSKTVMVEYSSPNTNKPLHLGHIRNNLLGYSISEILKANGNKVVKTNIVNDRGIHICKSMYAWQKWGRR